MTGTRLARYAFLLIAVVYGFFCVRQLVSISGKEKSCVCAYDGFGYYMYLPQLFGEGNLKMTPEAMQGLQDRYCDGAPAYQLQQRENGNYVNVYHMGQAALELPAFLAGHAAAKISGYPADGFSKPYHVAMVLNSFLFVLLGAWFTLKLLRLFFTDRLTALLLMLLFFGTNYLVNTLNAPMLQHHYLMALIAAFAYCLFRARKSAVYSNKWFYTAVALFGLCTFIRPTHVLLGILPFLLMIKVVPARKFWLFMMLFGLSAFVWNIPHFLYWKLVGGAWLLPNLHVEELIVIDPSLFDFLFSFRKGWLIYTPLFLLLIPGFSALRKKDKKLFWSLLVTMSVIIWILASWECWWYASSFGSRVMIDFYPLLLIPVGYALHASQKQIRLFVILPFLAFAVLLNGIQSYQYHTGLLHSERMSFDQYVHIFGKPTLPAYDDFRLLIDRSDTTWAVDVIKRNDPSQEIVTSVLYHLKQPLKSAGGKDIDLTKFVLLDKLPSDETLLKVVLEYTVSDTTKSTVLRLETVSAYNAYDWQSKELALGKHRNSEERMRFFFNLPDINHRRDKLQVYIDNDTGGPIAIHRMRIMAYTLIRK